VTSAAPWSPRDKAGVVAFQDRLYLLGGQSTADVWRSSNGRDWTRLADGESPISVVFHDKIWIYSGKHTGFDDNWGGDLWQMTTDTRPSG
jgi:hypothetical protein